MTGAQIERLRILCARPRPNPESAAILNTVVDEWVHALARHADVEMIEEDFDLAEVYARLRPDLLLFDAVHWGRPFRLQIANIDAHPELPRALYLNCDPHDPMRPLILQMLPIYGVEAIFTPGIEQLQQMRELRRAPCYPLPKFIDPAIFHANYDVPRSIPVTVLSAHLFPSYYPWRTQVTQDIQQIMPTLLYTHPGYAKGAHNPFAVEGESYARIIAQSQFCIADTTRLDYVVRKHLEIPAAGSVLVAPRSEALSDYGFVDMENCLLGAGEDLYRRMWQVASDPVAYERIRSMGHALVHARYTKPDWTYMLDWLRCRRALKAGEMVQQQGLFGRFEAVPATVGASFVRDFAVRENPMSERLEAMRRALHGKGDLGIAAARLEEASQWIHHIAEPWLLSGVVAMLSGDLEEAGAHFARRSTVQGRGDSSLGVLDPCEIAWIMLFAFIIDDDDLMAQMQQSALGTGHVAIRRMQWLFSDEGDAADIAADVLAGPLPDDCMSIHWIGDEDFQSWFALVQTVLDVHGMGEFAMERHDRAGRMLAAA